MWSKVTFKWQRNVFENFDWLLGCARNQRDLVWIRSGKKIYRSKHLFIRKVSDWGKLSKSFRERQHSQTHLMRRFLGRISIGTFLSEDMLLPVCCVTFFEIYFFDFVEIPRLNIRTSTRPNQFRENVSKMLRPSKTEHSANKKTEQQLNNTKLNKYHAIDAIDGPA